MKSKLLFILLTISLFLIAGCKPKDCESKGQEFCAGQCWESCEDGKIFICNEEGGLCKWDPENCPDGTRSCNNECWNDCEQGKTFKCDNKLGGLCA